VKRVYDVYQYIFSGEGEYVLDVHHIFSKGFRHAAKLPSSAIKI
jgi:hypothetical protein